MFQDAGGMKLTATYTTTAAPVSDDLDWSIGTRIRVVDNMTIGTGYTRPYTRVTMGATAVTFPRAVVNVEGTMTVASNLNSLTGGHGPAFQHTVVAKNDSGGAYTFVMPQGFVNAPFAIADAQACIFPAVSGTFNRPGQGTSWSLGFFDCPRYYALSAGLLTGIQTNNYFAGSYVASGARVTRRYGMSIVEGVGVVGYDTAVTTVAAGSNGVDVSTFAGSGTLNVADTSATNRTQQAFASTGTVTVPTSAGIATITYTGKSGTTFTGCTTTAGTGTLSTGGLVSAEGITDEFTGLIIGNMANDGTTIAPLRQAATSYAAKIAGQMLFYPSDTTFNSLGDAPMKLGNTYTINFTSLTFPAILDVRPSFIYGATAGTIAMRGVYYAPSITNDAAVSAGFATNSGTSSVRAFEDSSTVTADTKTALTLGAYNSFSSQPTFNVVNSGTITTGTYTGYRQLATIATGVTLSTATGYAFAMTVGGTVTTGTAFKINNPTVTGTLTTMYGLDIAAITTGGTNIGIRNLSTQRQVAAFTLGSDAATRTGLLFDQAAEGGFAVNPATSLTYAAPTSVDTTKGPSFKVTTVNATGSVTFNASSGGVDGQLMMIRITNDGTSGKTITFGTNFKSQATLVGTTSKVCTIMFQSDGTNWYEIARAGAAGGTTGM